ncbi:hypothetical protein [Propylenella binzhouense]|uniref:Sulfotransferase family protein n=1 Tax=Propylenella binzhouense TaxID=2555902 RepID=A0A964T5K6_9HYPH|nr:hypothetical protein [Propylenella binzhouense]MYZ48938.1 hypothetical protein [Propylenella binzhouense]
MTRRRLILHVGPHKTGSTYLQKRLFDARPQLREHGLVYPEFGMSIFGHHDIVEFLRRTENPAAHPKAEEMRAALAEHEQLIVSTENFVFLDVARLTAFRTIFHDYDIIPVFFARSMAEIWPSHWQELIKHGSDETFLEYLATVNGWLNCFDLSQIRRGRQIEKLAQVFGFENLVVISYDNITRTGGDVFDFFWRHVLDLPQHSLPKENAAINASLPPEHVEGIRILNQFHRERLGRPAGVKLRIAYRNQQRQFEQGEQFAAFRNEFRKRCMKIRLARNDPAIMQDDLDLMERFGSKILNRYSDNQLLADHSGEKVVECGQRDWIFRSESLPLFEELYARFTTDLAPAA